MYTSMMTLALVGLLSGAKTEAVLTWQPDYQQARDLAAETHKPLAVFVGQGAGGFAQVMQDQPISAETTQLLSKDYVCLYVDQSTATGAKLAAKLALAGQTGLVISDRSGKYQAFHLTGSLPAPVVEQTLVRYADPKTKVARTESLVATIPPATSPAATPPNGIIAPAMTYPTQGGLPAVPSMAYPTAQTGMFAPTMTYPTATAMSYPTMLQPTMIPAMGYNPGFAPAMMGGGFCPSCSGCAGGRCR